jgi:hypothetical protein
LPPPLLVFVVVSLSGYGTGYGHVTFNSRLMGLMGWLGERSPGSELEREMVP